MKPTALVTLTVLVASVSLQAQNTNGYLSMTTQLGVTRNRLIVGEPMQSNPTAFYNGFKAGIFVAPKWIIALEYSAFIYRWSNRSLYYDFAEDDWDYYPPTKGEKVNHYKLMVEFVPVKGLYLGAGAGLMNYRHFEHGYRDRGVGIYGSVTNMFTKHIGISGNIYWCNYNRYPFSGYFKAISAGLVLRIE